MEKLFRVGFLGTKLDESKASWEKEIGIRTYDLNTEQIINIVENVGQEGLNDQNMGLQLIQEYVLPTGGRMYYLPEDNTVHKVMEGVEVLIISGGINHISDAQMFLRGITEKCCSSLHTVVLRMPFKLDKDYERLLRLINSSVWLEGLGLKYKRCSLKNKKSRKQTNRQTLVIGDPRYDAIEPQVGLQELQLLLAQKELSYAVTKPIKETISAGKSILNLGQRFTSWIGKLVGGN